MNKDVSADLYLVLNLHFLSLFKIIHGLVIVSNKTLLMDTDLILLVPGNRHSDPETLLDNTVSTKKMLKVKINILTDLFPVLDRTRDESFTES